MSTTNNNKAKTKMYQTWATMKNLCRSQSYKQRGITYPVEWETFNGFSDDMGGSYETGLSLLRKDVDAPYSVENCFWGATSNKGRSAHGKGESGHKGVYRITDSNGRGIYRAFWRDPTTGKTRFKGFSSSKHGNDALLLAVTYRKQIIEAINPQKHSL